MKILKRYVITFIISVLLLFVLLQIMDFQSAIDRAEMVKILSNALAVIGVILSFFGVIMFVENCEGYRGMKAVAYNVKKFIHYVLPKMFQRDLEKSFYDYYQKKKKDKVPIAHLLIFGFCYLASSAVLAVVFEYL